jgi:hypothetical protein
MPKKQFKSFQDDINELSPQLQELLKAFSTGILNEEDIIAEIDDMDLNIKMVEKVYDLADKLESKYSLLKKFWKKKLLL